MMVAVNTLLLLWQQCGSVKHVSLTLAFYFGPNFYIQQPLHEKAEQGELYLTYLTDK